VVESASVKDASGNVVELKTLQPDGTYAEPGAVDDDPEGGGVESADETQPPVARDASADIQVLGGSDFVRVEDAADPQA
jgi:trigger factor